MLKTASVTYSYNDEKVFRFPDIQLESGQHLLILGKSGIGKTTLLHLLAGLIQPNNGAITIDGTDLSSLAPSDLDRFRGKHIGLVFQRPYFVRNLSVLDNLLMALHLSKQDQNRQLAEELLQKVGLGDKSHQKPHTLSQGEQQRAAIALAVIKKPGLILADEPTASLDDDNCNNIIQLLKEQAAATRAQLIIITHDQRLKNQFEQSVEL